MASPTSTTRNWPYVINLGNSIIGVSVLAMPFCFKQCGMILGMLLLLASAMLTTISCQLLMRAAMTSKKRSYEFLALHTLGGMGKLIVEISMIGLLIGTCIAFYVVTGDLGSAIISKFLGLENNFALRTSIMISVAFFIALPLGMCRNIDSLSNISAVSIGFYIVFVMEIFSLSLPHLWSGVWVTKVEFWNPEGVFHCLPIFALAFGCQSQLFVMYDALPEPSLKLLNSIVRNAVNMCTTVYLCVGFFGYIAFCDEDIMGNILINIHSTVFSEAIKMGFAFSVALSFPLVIFPCRASIYTLLFARSSSGHETGGAHNIPPFHFKLITVSLVMLTLTIGILIPNVEFILGLTGATTGSLICYIFPAIIFINVMSTAKNTGKTTAQVVLFVGVTLLIASTYVTLSGKDTSNDPPKSVVKIAENVAPKVPQAPLDLSVKNPGDGGNGKKINVIVPNKSAKMANLDLAGGMKSNVKDAVVKPEVKAADPDAKNEKRQEPPIPHAPVDADEKDKAAGDKVKINVDVKDKKTTALPTTTAPTTTTKKDADEAKHLISQLKEQQQEQQKLIQEHKKLIQELKQHKEEAHPDLSQDQAKQKQAEPAAVQPQAPQQKAQQQLQQQKPAQQLVQQPPEAQKPPVAQQPVDANKHSNVNEPSRSKRDLPSDAHETHGSHHATASSKTKATPKPVVYHHEEKAAAAQSQKDNSQLRKLLFHVI